MPINVWAHGEGRERVPIAPARPGSAVPDRRLIAAYAVIMGTLAALYFVWPDGRGHLLVALAAGAGAAIVAGVVRYRPRAAWPWLMLGASIVLEAGSRLLYNSLPGEPGRLKPWNWTVWSIQATALILLMVGVLGLVRSTLRGLSAAIDGAIIILGAGLVGGILIALPYASAATGAVEIVRAAYVVRDIVALALLVHVATAIRWSWSAAALLSGLTGYVVYETLYRLARSRGETPSGGALDVALIAFYILLGAAALVPSMMAFDSPVSPRGRVASPIRLGLVVLLALMPSAVLLLGLFREPPSYQALIVVTATLILVLALARIVDVAWQLRRQVHGERVVRDTVVELAGAQSVTALGPMLERAVGRLAPHGVPHAAMVVRSWADACRDSPPPPAGGMWCDSASLAPDLGGAFAERGVARSAPALAIPMRDPSSVVVSLGDDAPYPVLVIGAPKATLTALRPRLETLATQAGFALERIRVREENIRHTSESYFRTLVQNSADVILILSSDGRIRYASPSAKDLFAAAATPGVWLPSLFAEADRPRVEALLNGVYAQPATAETPAATSESRFDWTVAVDEAPRAQVEASGRDLRHDPSIGGIVVTLRDVTAQRRLEHELEQRALRDPLTGLSNRLPFSDRLDAVYRGDLPGVAAVLYADLDDLKMVNDAYGHEAGDAVLLAVGRRLTGFIDEYGGPLTNMAARIGGDEFVVLLTGLPDAASADRAATRLLQSIGRPVQLDGHDVRCRLSIGVATCADEEARSDLLRNADLALYAAKGAGKGHWRHYEPWMRSTVMERLEVRASLERAIADGALRIEHQPIVALDDAKPVGFEALLRWEHPTRGRLTPDQFIDVAEESGLITPIGEWVLEAAVASARRWADIRPDDPPYVSVNVSARQFRSSGFTESVDRILNAAGLPRDRVMLEITESLLLRDEDEVWQDLRRLRRSGVRIAIDDFGTGYSALSYLRYVPLDVIKLDRSFTQTMVGSEQQRELVHGIVGLAEVLGLDVIAEGIETAGERDAAASIGCAYGQGFLFSQPLPPDLALEWLREADRALDDRRPVRAAD